MIKWSKFSTKAKKIGSKVKGVAKKYPKTTFGAGATAYLVGGGAIYGNTEYARVHQNQKIEMQKIAKERKTRKISRQEITARLAKAKKSKREFTYFLYGKSN